MSLVHAAARGRAREVAYEDAMAIPYEPAIHKGISVLGHGQGIWIVVFALPHEGETEPVNDWLEINLSSRVNDGSSQSTPHISRHKVSVLRDIHVELIKFNCISYFHRVKASVFSGESPQQVQIGVGGQCGIYCFCCWYVWSSADLMQDICSPVCAYDSAAGSLALGCKGGGLPKASSTPPTHGT